MNKLTTAFYFFIFFTLGNILSRLNNLYQFYLINYCILYVNAFYVPLFIYFFIESNYTVENSK